MSLQGPIGDIADQFFFGWSRRFLRYLTQVNSPSGIGQVCGRFGVNRLLAGNGRQA